MKEIQNIPYFHQFVEYYDTAELSRQSTQQ